MILLHTLDRGQNFNEYALQHRVDEYVTRHHNYGGTISSI